MEMHWALRDKRDDRRRRLCAWSRHDETPAECVIELTADGRDYLVVDDPGDDETREGWELLHLVLREAGQQLTRKQILQGWPAHRPPNEATLWRWLQLALQRRQILQLGAGLKGDPFRYQLPDRDLPYHPDPFESLGLASFL